MKKLTLFATALAAVFAASSCSSDDSLVELNQAPKGKPFVINVANNDGTRGADITAVSKFNLSGTYGTNNWIPNYLFTKPEDAWVATGHTDLAWPTAAQVGENTHTFYATCDNTSDAPAIAADGTFEYTVPAAIADQKDLLVAAVTDAAHETPVALTFKHALSSVKFKIGFDVSALADDENATNDIRIKVTKIGLYNIPTSGTFSFGTSNWTVSNTPNPQNFEIVLKKPAEFGMTAKESFLALDNEYVDGEVFVLPHKPTAWTASGSLSNAYIAVTCQIYEVKDVTFGEQYDGDNSDKDLYQGAPYYGKNNVNQSGWSNDYNVYVYAPQQFADDDYDEDTEQTTINGEPDVTLLSDMEYRTTNSPTTAFETVYLPLKMTNGFGFNKTNTLNIQMHEVRDNTGTSILGDFVTIEAGD